MTRRILILGNNLAGLITAFRLIPYGFHLQILESSAQSSSPSFTEIPPFIHACHRKTWAFLQEIHPVWTQPFRQSFFLDFHGSSTIRRAFPWYHALQSIHPILGMAFILNLSWSDRWNLVNFFERQWEEKSAGDLNMASSTVMNWLQAAKQSSRSCEIIWKPLCRFFLGCDPHVASLPCFLRLLSQHFLRRDTKPTSHIFTPTFHQTLREYLYRELHKKDVSFISPTPLAFLDMDKGQIEAVRLKGGERLTADFYIAPLPPHDLTSLIPEHALTRFSYFSQLAQLREVSGTTITVQVPHPLHAHRLILGRNSWDWIVATTSSRHDSSFTTVIFSIFNDGTHADRAIEDLLHTAWSDAHVLFNIPVPPHKNEEIFIERQAYSLLPCLQRTQQFRPITQSSIPNFFVTGPWGDTPFSSSLESLLWSADSCCHAIVKSFYSRTD